MTTLASNLEPPSEIDELLRLFEDPTARPPPLPNIAVQLPGLISDPKVRFPQVVALLEQDEMLAGAVLRLVQSPIYAGRSEIRSLHDAVVRLGLSTIRDVVFETSLRQGVFRVDGYSEVMEHISRHSIVTAYLSRLICSRANVVAEQAFLCGLLHDIGFAGLVYSLSRTAAGSDIASLADRWTSLDVAHEQASLTLARMWQLPDEFLPVIGNHHDPIETEEHATVASIVCVANHMSADYGADIVGERDAHGDVVTGDVTLWHEEAMEHLELSSESLLKIREDADRVIPEILWV